MSVRRPSWRVVFPIAMFGTSTQISPAPISKLIVHVIGRVILGSLLITEGTIVLIIRTLMILLLIIHVSLLLLRHLWFWQTEL
jgi:hypothetical protein